MRLQLRGISKAFGSATVLDDISADFAEANAVVFIGPSGGGKSTLLRVIAGLETPDRGSVQLGEEAVDYSSEDALRAYRRKLGIVFQAFNLFPHFTALENVALPLKLVHGHTPSAAAELARAALAQFRLAEHSHKKPAELSGGQKQRVAIARALAVQPQVLLLDEPTSALDPEMTAEVLETIEQLKVEGRHFILVTHEMGFARQVGDRVAFLSNGRIVEEGAPDRLFTEPQTPECRSFLARVLKY